MRLSCTPTEPPHRHRAAYFGYPPLVPITISQPFLYDPSNDAIFPQIPIPGTSSLQLTTLLADGRVLGFGSTSTGNIGGQIYTPAAFSNSVPVVSYINSNQGSSNTGIVKLDIYGSSFTPNTVVSVGQSRLVALYFGSTHLIAFVTAGLQASLTSGVVLTNPGTGGGSALPVLPDAIAAAPQVIPEVESGTIRTGYVVVPPNGFTASPVATLTYGVVHNAVVQYQASILPAGAVTDTSVGFDFVPAASRNLGIAITNTNALPASINLTAPRPEPRFQTTGRLFPLSAPRRDRGGSA
jgi:hypothetical protein